MSFDQGQVTLALEFYERMFLIRTVEKRLLSLFSMGMLTGTTHTSIGQEACAVGVVYSLDRPRDVIFSNHRCHGHYLALTDDVEGLFAEIMGKATGVCGGVGGSQHLHRSNFYTNGIQGGIVPVAAGMAYAEKRKQSKAIVVCFIGDGTMGQGVVYESMNIAALWSLPILYVMENNQYAQTTPTAMAHAGAFADRARGFGIPAEELDAWDVMSVYDAATVAANEVRRLCSPRFLILNTYRLGPHSKGDDFRPPDEIESYRQKDPLMALRRGLPIEEVTAIEATSAARVEAAVQAALADDVQKPEAFFSRIGGMCLGSALH